MNSMIAADPAPILIDHLSKHLGEPVIHARQEREHHAPHHHVMEMGDHEICVVQRNVRGQRTQEQPGQPADA